MTTDNLRRLVCPTGSAEPVDNMTAPGGRTPGTSAGGSPHGRRDGSQPSYEGSAERPPRPGPTPTIAAAGDAGSPGDANSPDVTRASRDITADDVLERIRDMRATDDSIDDRLIGWLAASAPEIVWAVLNDMTEFAATHDGSGR